jgi:hypothetical protein
MKPQCIAAVQAAAAEIGREGLTTRELNEIEARLQSTMRRLARTEDGWQGMSRDMRFSLAAEQAVADVRAEAALKVQRAQMQVVARASTDGRIASILGKFKGLSRSEALGHDMTNVENGISGLRARTMSRLVGMVDAVRNADGTSFGRRAAMFLWDADNPQMTADLAHEIYANADGTSGNKIAQQGAQAWLQVLEELRQRFNAAGGDVGKLDYGYAPITHDFRRVRGANDPASRDTWVAKTLGLLDRGRYVDETGARVTDAELTKMLGEVWETIKSDGLNKQTPGQFKGSGARANAGSEARVLHFRDGAAYLEYMGAYGRGSMYDLMMGHLGKMARDIGLVEAYGPNPEAQMRTQFDLARQADGGELKRFGFGVGIMRINAEGMWRTLSGAASAPGSELGAAFFRHVRNVQALKLAGTFLKMFPDLATYFVTTGFNKLGYWDALVNLGRSPLKANRDWAATHGLMADSMARGLNRFMGENIGQGWSARLSNSQMKLTLGELWTDTLDRAFGLTKMAALGRLAAKDWGNLGQWDRILLERAGVTEEDWGVVRSAQLDTLNGQAMLTPDAIIATGHESAAQVADKILGIVKNQTADAIIKPDLETRTVGTWNGTQSGTGLGELARSVMQFKSFPIAMITRHWRTMMNAPKVTDGSAPALANPLLYAGALGVSATALGAISTQATQVASGKNPIDMTGPHAGKFWLQAFATGGAGGFYADLLTRDSSQDRSAQDTIGKTLGPSASDLANVVQLTKGNIDDRLAGKPTHAAAQGLQFTRSHIPYLNIWYAKAAIDHAGMQALQENVSPGYLARMRQSAAQQWNQDYWWAPGTGAPQRAPDLAKAVGQ